jgi:hypothetical protein
MKMKKKRKINNTFFEFILYIFSIMLSFLRSIKLLVGSGKIKNNLFFESLDFIFKIWPKSFWNKPSFYKIFSFPGDLFKFILKK